MPKIYICNAFSLSMLDREEQRKQCDASSYQDWSPVIRVPYPIDDPVAYLAKRDLSFEIESAVGHADVAAIFSAELGRDIAVNRINVKLTSGNAALIGQYIGPQRLPEGATKLPERAKIEWWVV
jgi:hypothetical protein